MATEIKLKLKYRVGGRSTQKSASSNSGASNKKAKQANSRRGPAPVQKKRVMIIHANGKARMYDA